MNMGEIAERLITAAEIEDAAYRFRVGPAHAKSLPLPYAHSLADRNGWGESRNNDESHRVWEDVVNRPTARMITEAEEAWSWLRLVDVVEERAALAAWVRCTASGGRLYFKDWCFKNRIHPNTGTDRKNRALARISAHLVRQGSQNCTTGLLDLLLTPPEMGHSEGTLEEDAARWSGDFSWRGDPSLRPTLVPEMADFDWSEKRNERRRQKRKQREREAAKAAQEQNPSSPIGPPADQPRK